LVDEPRDSGPEFEGSIDDQADKNNKQNDVGDEIGFPVFLWLHANRLYPRYFIGKNDSMQRIFLWRPS
jgi:hypothetical protein